MTLWPKYEICVCSSPNSCQLMGVSIFANKSNLLHHIMIFSVTVCHLLVSHFSAFLPLFFPQYRILSHNDSLRATSMDGKLAQ